MTLCYASRNRTNQNQWIVVKIENRLPNNFIETMTNIGIEKFNQTQLLATKTYLFWHFGWLTRWREIKVRFLCSQQNIAAIYRSQFIWGCANSTYFEIKWNHKLLNHREYSVEWCKVQILFAVCSSTSAHCTLHNIVFSSFGTPCCRVLIYCSV